MPWQASDAINHTKMADNGALQKVWAEVANSTREREMEAGKSPEECDAIAIRTANAAVAKAKGTKESLAETVVLCEFVDSRGLPLTVDREAGVVHGVKILGLESRNGRTYLKEAAARAASLYEGAKVNVNHPRGNPGGPRDYQDRIGTIRSVRVEHADGGLRADFHFNPKHALAEQLIWDAEHSPENVGFSHNVEARRITKGGKEVVEEIVRVQSVDLVADPATTRGLFEHQTGKENEVDLTTLTEADLRAHCPTIVTAIAEKALAEHADSEAEKARVAELKALKEEVATLKAEKAEAEKAAAITAELAEAKLPDAVADLIRPQLVGAADAAARKPILEAAQKVAAGIKTPSRPQSKERQVAEGVTVVTDAKSFAAAITE